MADGDPAIFPSSAAQEKKAEDEATKLLPPATDDGACAADEGAGAADEGAGAVDEGAGATEEGAGTDEGAGAADDGAGVEDEGPAGTDDGETPSLLGTALGPLPEPLAEMMGMYVVSPDSVAMPETGATVRRACMSAIKFPVKVVFDESTLTAAGRHYSIDGGDVAACWQ